MLPEKTKSDINPEIEVVNYGEIPHDVPLQVLTTYPQGAGFPFFTWAQLFFTNANHVSPETLIEMSYSAYIQVKNWNNNSIFK